MPLYRFFTVVLSCALLVPFATVQASKPVPNATGFSGKLQSSSTYIRGNCSATMRPDRAYIAGAVEGEGERPALAKQIIQKKISGLQQLANKHGGKLVKMEMVRSIKTERKQYNSLERKYETKQIFVITQRFELDFPAKVDIDTILEKFVALKVDHIGKRVSRHRSSRPEVLARYRFSNLKGKLERIHQRCRAEAFAQWCQANAAPNEQGQCKQAVRKVAGEFQTASLNMRSQEVLSNYGSTRSISSYYPWRDYHLKYFDLVGNVTLKFDGTISLRRNR